MLLVNLQYVVRQLLKEELQKCEKEKLEKKTYDK